MSELVGPGRWFRYALGAGGAIYHGNCANYTRDSRGDGALRICAPEILFGANDRITADGGDGTYSWDKDNPSATGDRAKVTATGGGSTDANGTVVRDASNRAGYIGMT